MKRQGKLNMHIIFESVLMLSTKKLLKLVRPCGNYSMPNLARFFETQCILRQVICLQHTRFL